jgi:8-oxo-dGTP pyrophosphatase MutT (NUDIX family)
MAVRKVLIYATSGKGLLVFDEPDFPEIALQIPGGTVEAGESVAVAARREFEEETGLSLAEPPTPLGTVDHVFVRDGNSHIHRRSYFHVRLDDDLPPEWLHHEQTPFDGSPPILFRFFWMPVEQARSRLGYGMEELLPRIASLDAP